VTTGISRSREVQTMTSPIVFSRPAVRLGIPAAVLAVALTVPPLAFAADDANHRTRSGRSRAGRIVHPAPIEAALNLLRWAPEDVPAIEVIEKRPLRVDLLAEAWVFYNVDATAQPTIYVAGWSRLYRHALADPRDRHDVIRLAGVLAHERAHIRHGRDEELAYAEQLTTLEKLQAPAVEVTNVRRALQALRLRMHDR
jgi:hypothetical protein